MITLKKFFVPARSKLAAWGVPALMFAALSFHLHAQPGQVVSKLVFAHYMVCCPAAGGAATVEDFMDEIREAQSRGVDGFALNNGGWNITEPHYEVRTLRIYAAAEKLNSNFKLFISADRKVKDEIEDIVNTVKNLPNQLKVSGRPVLSTFGGEIGAVTNDKGLVSRARGTGAFFVPYFYPRPQVKERPSAEDARDLADHYPELDGFFYFGAAGSGSELSQSNAVTAHAWTSRGKVFMAQAM
nr:endo-1,3-alpha-glucanase family glycosylhydrolase [uncultured Rhodoferax sp.]